MGDIFRANFESLELVGESSADLLGVADSLCLPKVGDDRTVERGGLVSRILGKLGTFTTVQNTDCSGLTFRYIFFLPKQILVFNLS